VSQALVLALISDAQTAAAVAAGFEEEGVPLTVAAAGFEEDNGPAAAPEARAREAARRALLGIGIGGDHERLVLTLAGSIGRPYLRAPAAAAREFGRDAARVAARRPLADTSYLIPD
jgi:Dehydratase medium subunit